jgi:ATP-dependent Clp protease ATP-binding subunit ClpA
MGTVFERFSDQARRVVVGAQEEARGLSHNFIGTEHLLLGILRDDGCAGFRLLEAFELSLDGVRTRILEIIGRGQAAATGHIPFTPRAKKVLEMSLREALHLGDRFIGSEHILLGLLREGRGVGAQVLTQQGVTLTAVRQRLGDVEREQAPDTDETEPDPEAVAGEEMIHVPAEHFARVVAEVARLRDLLRRHGIDPGEEPFGDEGDPPVA